MPLGVGLVMECDSDGRPWPAQASGSPLFLCKGGSVYFVLGAIIITWPGYRGGDGLVLLLIISWEGLSCLTLFSVPLPPGIDAPRRGSTCWARIFLPRRSVTENGTLSSRQCIFPPTCNVLGRIPASTFRSSRMQVYIHSYSTRPDCLDHRPAHLLIPTKAVHLPPPPSIRNPPIGARRRALTQRQWARRRAVPLARRSRARCTAP